MSLRKVLAVIALAVVGVTVALLLIAIATISVLNRTNGTIVSSGEKREYLLYVPATYDPTRPTPLVVSLHGAAVWPAQQRNLSNWDTLADRDGFIVVYPAGSGAGPRLWHANRGIGLQKDIRFVADLIDTLETTYNIDRARIFVNGFSLGGGMTFALSCALSDRIAAVGMVAAAQTLPSSWCTDHRPMPMIAFHGTADLVPYDGGPSPDPFNPVMFPPVRAWTASWARRNDCERTPLESVIDSGVSRLQYRNCAASADVVLFTLKGAGHQWPGGKRLPSRFFGPASNAIDATALMWTFFRDHPKQPIRRN